MYSILIERRYLNALRHIQFTEISATKISANEAHSKASRNACRFSCYFVSISKQCNSAIELYVLEKLSA